MVRGRNLLGLAGLLLSTSISCAEPNFDYKNNIGTKNSAEITEVDSTKCNGINLEPSISFIGAEPQNPRVFEKVKLNFHYSDVDSSGENLGLANFNYSVAESSGRSILLRTKSVTGKEQADHGSKDFSVDYGFSNQGKHLLEAVVEDSCDGLSSTRFVVPVVNWVNHPNSTNNAPEIEFMMPSPVNTTIDEDGVYSVNVSDPENDSYQVNFDMGDGTVTDWSSTNSVVHAYAEPGEYIVTSCAKDSHEAEACTTLDVRVDMPGLYVSAGPNMTLQRDVPYCVVFVPCEPIVLEIACGVIPYAPNHSKEGFVHSDNIMPYRVYEDFSRSSIPSFGDSGCGTITYYSDSGLYHYQSGDKASIRFIAKDSEGNEVYDEALVDLE